MALIDSNPASETAAADLSLKTNLFGKQTSTGINVCSVAGERADGVIGSGKPSGLGKGLDFYLERIFPVKLGVGGATKGDELTTDALGQGVLALSGQFVNAIAAETGVAGQVIAVQHPLAGGKFPTGGAGVANLTNNQVEAGVPVIYTFAVPDAATSDIDIVVAQKVEVVDIVCRKDAGAGAGNTMQVKNAANVISNAIACDTDKTITRAGTIDVAFNTINAGGTLRLTATRAAGTRTALVEVRCIRRA